MTHSKISEDLLWTDKALCRDHDPEMWFPNHNPGMRDRAKRICAACPVLYECRAYSIAATMAGIEHGIEGIWGGLSRADRKGKKARFYLAEARMKIEERAYESNGSHR